MNVDIDYLIETTEKLLKRLEGPWRDGTWYRFVVCFGVV